MLYNQNYNLAPINISISIIILFFIEILLGIIICFTGSYSLFLPFVFLGCGIFAIAFLKPEIGFLLIIISIPFSQNILEKNGISFRIDTVHILLAITAAGWFFNTDRLKIKFTPVDLPIFLLILWMLTGIFWTPSMANGFIWFLKIFAFIVLYFLAVQIFNSERIIIQAIYTWIFTAALFSGISVIYSLIHGFSIAERLEFISAGSNTLGTYLMISIILGFSLLIYNENKGKKIRLLFCILNLLMIAGIALTLSRASWIGLIVGLIYLLIKTKKFHKYFGIGIITTSIFISTMIISEGKILPTVGYRAYSIVNTLFEIEDTFRVKLWKGSIDVFFSSYGLGGGIGSYTKTLKPYCPKFKTDGNKSFKGYHPHNFYLSILLDLGLIGILIFLVFIYRLIFYLHSSMKKYKGAKLEIFLYGTCGGLIAFFLRALVDHELNERNFWVLLGLAMGIAKFIEQSEAFE